MLKSASLKSNNAYVVLDLKGLSSLSRYRDKDAKVFLGKKFGNFKNNTYFCRKF